MAEKKIIVVAGATGAQGGGLVRAILNDPKGGFAVRALTRDVNSEKARELASLGAEVVAADIGDEAALTKAYEEAYGAYCVTFFWSHFSPLREFAEASAMARAAKTAGLKHVIWSTLEDTRKWVKLDDHRMPTLMGNYKVPHFDAKGEADDVFRQLGLPVTFLLTSFYWDNFIYFGSGPQKGPDGRLAITLPMGYNAVEPAVYRSLGFPGADDLGNMFQFNRDFADYFCGVRDITLSRKLNPDLQSLKVWLDRNASKIPLG